jgi:biopolymer transport protein ExbD
MAGSQDTTDNPVAINVVPMVDVIFCLCVFFMCSFKFKDLEGQFAAWLPKDKGNQPSAVPPEEIRVALLWDEATHSTSRRMGQRRVDTDGELQRLIGQAAADAERVNQPRIPLILDADRRVPWGQLVTVINLGKREGIQSVEFAWGPRDGR